ncbi:MAG: high-affinity iron transporter [Actinomycetota bacterium]|nr:high-affinity iron transporter [Actinomycetota bacterium]
MGSAFLIMLREGLEGALIVAILLAYLKVLDQKRHFVAVWLGTLAGIGVALIAGAIVFAVLGRLHGRAEAITEGIVAFTAAAVLTWMIVWMSRQARYLKGALHAKVDAALASGSAGALASIAFVAISREGLESALFMLGTTVGAHSHVAEFIGGLIGVAAAAVIGYLVYRGSHLINLRWFFRVTGALIILFAAGLLATGIHEFQEGNLLPTMKEHIWNVTNVAALNPDRSSFGGLLHGLLGWSPDPSIEMAIVYLLFLIPIGTIFLLQTRKVPMARQPKKAEAGAAPLKDLPNTP